MYHVDPNVTSDVVRVRLVNETGDELDEAGRVEVYYGGEWGSICGHSWDLADANVICRQLGYAHAIRAITYVYVHSHTQWRKFYNFHRYAGYRYSSTGPIWMDYISCNGTEMNIGECDFPGWGISSCSHYQDAGVVCASMFNIM